MNALLNRAISGARAAWYSAYEPWRLAWERANDPPPYFGGDPLVSVIIPTHNRAEILMERALPSVLRQSYKNLEVIVAAHGCTDATIGRCMQLMPNDPIFGPPHDHRIRLIKVPRTRTYPPTVENHWFAGPVVPLNAALKAARGAWIARIDDDDTWSPDHVEVLLRAAQAGDWEFVSGAYQRDNGRPPGFEKGQIGPRMLEIIRHDGGDPPIGGCQTWLYRSYLKFMRYNPDCWRKSWNKVNDTDLAQRLRDAGVRIGHFDRVVAYVTPRPGESTVGLEAYRRDAEAKQKHFAF